MNRTTWNPDWSAAIARITSMVEAMFLCRAKFSSIESFLEGDSRADFAEQDLAFIESVRFEPPSLIRSHRVGKFAFPLRVRRFGAPASDVSLVGIATIEGLAAFDDDRLNQIVEFLHLAVESRLDAFERLMDIEQREKQLEQEQTVRESSKVVSLFPRQVKSRTEDRFHQREESDFSAFQLPTAQPALELTKPLLLLNEKIARGSQLGLEKIALEIFNRSSHWFFVNIQDLSEDAFRSAAAFRELGKMCVYIPDLSDLSIEKQLRLAEVFSAVKEEIDSPSFIAFSSEEPKTLVGKGSVLPHLLDLMAMIHVPAALTLAVGSHGSIMCHRSLVPMLREISATLSGLSNTARGSKMAESAAIIPLMGKWNQDNSPNPTFH
jgi:hypothetical protein